MFVSSIAVIVGLVVLGAILLTLFLFSMSPDWWLAQNEEIVRLGRGEPTARASRIPKFNRIEKLMSEDQLYELARRRIDRRNRRGILLGVDIFAFMIYIGAFVALYSHISRPLGVFIALIWLGVLVFHTIYLSMTQNRDEDIEREVAKLRDQVYEKPKRLELDSDGELVDFPESTTQKTRDQG